MVLDILNVQYSHLLTVNKINIWGKIKLRQVGCEWSDNQMQKKRTRTTTCGSQQRIIPCDRSKMLQHYEAKATSVLQKQEQKSTA